jgi:hypothetical protein
MKRKLIILLSAISIVAWLRIDDVRHGWQALKKFYQDLRGGKVFTLKITFRWD